MVLLITQYKVFLTFEFADDILKRDNSNENYSGTVIVFRNATYLNHT